MIKSLNENEKDGSLPKALSPVGMGGSVVCVDSQNSTLVSLFDAGCPYKEVPVCSFLQS